MSVGAGPAQLLCFAHAVAMAVATARHGGGGGAPAGPRLAGGAAWPARSRGSPAGLAQGGAGAAAGRRREACAAALGGEGRGSCGGAAFRPGHDRPAAKAGGTAARGSRRP